MWKLLYDKLSEFGFLELECPNSLPLYEAFKEAVSDQLKMLFDVSMQAHNNKDNMVQIHNCNWQFGFSIEKEYKNIYPVLSNSAQPYLTTKRLILHGELWQRDDCDKVIRRFKADEYLLTCDVLAPEYVEHLDKILQIAQVFDTMPEIGASMLYTQVLAPIWGISLEDNEIETQNL